jgi:hypothetical protein
MDISMDVRNVVGIELGEQHESTNGEYFWRELTIRTSDGEVRVSLYTKDMFDDDALKVRA